jgi:hypothetical protein
MDKKKVRDDIRASGLTPLTVEEIIAKTDAKAKYDIAYVLDEPDAPGYASIVISTYETGGNCSASKRRSDRAKALKKIMSVDETLAVSLAKESDADIQAALHRLYADGRLKAPKPRMAQTRSLSKFVRETLKSGKRLLSVTTCPRIKSSCIGRAKLIGDRYEICLDSEFAKALVNDMPAPREKSPYKEHRSLSCGKILAIERRGKI